METAKIFMSGRSQAVRIPQKFRFHATEVQIRKKGNDIILSPISKEDILQAFLELPAFPDFEVPRGEVQQIQTRVLF